MSLLYLREIAEGIEITTFLDETEGTIPRISCKVIRPGESFGGFNHDELREIARTRGKMDGNELRG
jgi:hypothetical protein